MQLSPRAPLQASSFLPPQPLGLEARYRGVACVASVVAHELIFVGGFICVASFLSPPTRAALLRASTRPILWQASRNSAEFMINSDTLLKWILLSLISEQQMRPLFTVHAGEFLVGQHIERNFKNQTFECQGKILALTFSSRTRRTRRRWRCK
jgi:hypothetical protein